MQNFTPAEVLRIVQVAVEFVEDIEATGGVSKDTNGSYYPNADPEWIDLADTYFRMCTVLKRPPKITPTDIEYEPEE